MLCVTSTGLIFTKIKIFQQVIVKIYCVAYFPSRTKNELTGGKRPITPSRKVQLLLRQFSQNS